MFRLRSKTAAAIGLLLLFAVVGLPFIVTFGVPTAISDFSTHRGNATTMHNDVPTPAESSAPPMVDDGDATPATDVIVENVTVMMPLNIARDNQLCELLDGLTRFGYHDVVIFGEGSGARDKMRGNMFFTMASHALRWVATNRPEGENRTVVLIDALDVLVTRPATVLVERYRRMGSPEMLISGDTGCLGSQEVCDVFRRAPCWMLDACPRAWSHRPRNLTALCSPTTWNASLFPDDVPAYPNSGSIMGTAGSLHRVMSVMLGTSACDRGIDQGWFTLRAAVLGLVANGTVVVDVHSAVFGNINSGGRHSDRSYATVRGLYYDLVALRPTVPFAQGTPLSVQYCWRDEGYMERAVCTVADVNGSAVRDERGAPLVFELALGNFSRSKENRFPAFLHFSGGGKAVFQLALHAWRNRFPTCEVGRLPNVTVVRALGDNVTTERAARFCPCCGADGFGAWKFTVRNRTTVAKITATPRPLTRHPILAAGVARSDWLASRGLKKFRVGNSNLFVAPENKRFDKIWRIGELGPFIRFDYAGSPLTMASLVNLTNASLTVPECNAILLNATFPDVAPVQRSRAWAVCPT